MVNLMTSPWTVPEVDSASQQLLCAWCSRKVLLRRRTARPQQSVQVDEGRRGRQPSVPVWVALPRLQTRPCSARGSAASSAHTSTQRLRHKASARFFARRDIHLEHITDDLLQGRRPSLGPHPGKRLFTQRRAGGSQRLLIVGAFIG
jgi:hypothetical protein